jgi:aryl-alcohol dehydrogenase-like predicted oxidoreductase
LAAPRSEVPTAMRDRVAAVRAACARHGVPPLAAAIQFPFRHPAVTAVVVGARSAGEIEESADLMRVPVPDALWAELASI